MTNKQLIQAFVNGATTGESRDLKIEGRNLRGMNTIFAQRIGNGEGSNHFVLNVSNYSNDATRMMRDVAIEVPENKILRIVDDVPIGVDWLI